MSELVRVLWNPQAGSAAGGEEVRSLLEGQDGVRIVETRKAEDLRRGARDAAAHGVRLLVVAGGDGSVSAAAAALADAQSPETQLGVLPLGTANDFCRTLGLPPDPVDAARLLLDLPESREIDLLVLSREGERDHCFVNTASGGNAAEVTRHLDPDTKSRWGPLCYVRGAVDVLADLTVFDVRLRFDDGIEEHHELLTLVACNGRFCAGGLCVDPLASLEDGKVDLIAIPDAEPIDLAAHAGRLVTGHFLEGGHVIHRRARTIDIESSPGLSFSADGEVLPKARSTRFSVRPKALRAVVGPDYEAEGR